MELIGSRSATHDMATVRAHTTSIRAASRALRSRIKRNNASRTCRGSTVSTHATLRAVVFDCDGVILESEDLHRVAYNATFEEFDVRNEDDSPEQIVWTEEFYNEFQNQVGGGKPKMRWYFNKYGWPTSNLGPAPTTDEEKEKLIDELQDWKSTKYQDFITSGKVPPRPGVVRLMDEARAAGLKVAVCSAATKSSVEVTLKALIGKDRFETLDVFMAGDDVPKKKPDPIIYVLAAEKLGVDASECLVIEDSLIGLQAALGAKMKCVVTHTPSTASQDFDGADLVLPQVGDELTIDRLKEVISA